MRTLAAERVFAWKYTTSLYPNSLLGVKKIWILSVVSFDTV
jgi:hypothetical protein